MTYTGTVANGGIGEQHKWMTWVSFARRQPALRDRRAFAGADIKDRGLCVRTHGSDSKGAFSQRGLEFTQAGDEAQAAEDGQRGGTMADEWAKGFAAAVKEAIWRSPSTTRNECASGSPCLLAPAGSRAECRRPAMRGCLLRLPGP